MKHIFSIAFSILLSDFKAKVHPYIFSMSLTEFFRADVETNANPLPVF